jgi:CheY-like chemotaxis protein
MEINYNQFLISVRSALHFLYDPNQLLRSPLIELFGLSENFNPASVLQKTIVEAIEKVRPGPNEPPQARGWLLHDVLFLRYVRGYERNAIMNQLGLSDRQLSREQKAAIETLAQLLIEAFHVSNIRNISPGQSEVFDLVAQEALPGATASGEENSSWMENLPVEKFSPWKTIVFSVIDLLQPLIQKNGTLLLHNLDEDMPDIQVPQNALRHSLMNIMSAMLPAAQQGSILLTGSVIGQELRISVVREIEGRGDISHTDFPPNPPNFEVARNLIDGVNGKLTFTSGDERFETEIIIPSVEEIPILVIDDNADMVQLFQRYVLGTRFSITSEAEPSRLFDSIHKVHPRIILLDLMMPESDGWDILAQLRQAELDFPFSVVVCSILPMETLAYSLGANGFLQKPVLPQDFLRVLNKQIDNQQSENSSGQVP